LSKPGQPDPPISAAQVIRAQADQPRSAKAVAVQQLVQQHSPTAPTSAAQHRAFDLHGRAVVSGLPAVRIEVVVKAVTILNEVVKVSAYSFESGAENGQRVDP
jgi:hypothetical protein